MNPYDITFIDDLKAKFCFRLSALLPCRLGF